MGNEEPMSNASNTPSRARTEPRREVHHGRTGAAWAGVTIAFVGLLVCMVAFFLGPNWTLFWISIAILALSLIATVVLQKLGFGADG